jgi:hypothetical protein
MNNKNDLLFRSALAALGRILIAADNGCGKGSCGKDEKGADAAKKASKKKGKESSCKTAEGGKDASCSTHDKAAMGKGADKGK